MWVVTCIGVIVANTASEASIAILGSSGRSFKRFKAIFFLLFYF